VLLKELPLSLGFYPTFRVFVMPKKFCDAIEGVAATVPILPLVHTTSSPAFEFSITSLSPQALKTNHCKVYNESLLYTFYAKPSFLPQDADTLHIRQMKQFAPVCLVIEAPSTFKPKRILPTDSGAWSNGLIAREGHAHRSLPIELFELNDLDAARAIVELFYGSNVAYYDEIPKLPCPVDPRTNTCVETYLSLISRTGSNHGDSRLSTIEVQFDQNIELSRPGTVLAVAMAEDLHEQREHVRNALGAWRAEALLYELPARYSASGCRQTIDRLIRSFLEDRQRLS